MSSAVWGPVFADGGVAASALELAKFANALLGGRPVSAATVRQMTHLGSANYSQNLANTSCGLPQVQ